MDSIIFEKKDQVGIVRLNRPDVFNSFNRQMATELQNTLDDCNNDSDIRCIYITGVGKAFCAGQDLGEAIDPNGPGLETIVDKTYNPIIRRLRTIQKPVISAVNGVAAGAGANIALACDICLAHENASFIQAFSKIGLIPDSGGTFVLPRLIGFQKALALSMLGEKVSAHDAERMGMIFRVFSDEEFGEESMKIATKLSLMPTKGLWLTKKAFNEGLTNNLDSQLEEEKKLQVEAGNTHDYKEGVNAFLEKRKPAFKGH